MASESEIDAAFWIGKLTAASLILNVPDGVLPGTLGEDVRGAYFDINRALMRLNDIRAKQEREKSDARG